MKNLSLLVFATSALLGACSNDNGAGGTPDGGTGGTQNDASSGAGGKAGATSAGGSGATAGTTATGGSGGGGAGGTNAGGAVSDSGSDGASMADAGPDGSSPRAREFTVTIENVGTVKLFTSGGVFNTPVGDTSPGPATPGKMYQFSVDAGRKQKLSFATMLAATNDLFYGPDGDGIALYDDHGDPISGDVTSQIHLWDAGTEINEEPHEGPNTVTKQSAPNTGPDEHGNVVDIADATDGVKFNYPAVNEVIKVTVMHTTGTMFNVSIEDVSSATALHTSGGDFPAPLSPGVWVVHNGADPLYTVGKPDRMQGLEHLAEDGNPTTLGTFVAGNVGITYPASPGVWVVHKEGTKPLFTKDKPDYGDGIEGIAEDGNPSNLAGNLSKLDGEIDGAVFNMPAGSSSAGPIVPGSKYQFTVQASPGDALSFATMLAATNDVFFAPSDMGIALFDADGKPVTGDVTDQISLWDAGTEGNEQPGIGPNTVTNQLAPNTGTPGEGKVQLLGDVGDGFSYPTVNGVLKVTIAAR